MTFLCPFLPSLLFTPALPVYCSLPLPSPSLSVSTPALCHCSGVSPFLASAPTLSLPQCCLCCVRACSAWAEPMVRAQAQTRLCSTRLSFHRMSEPDARAVREERVRQRLQSRPVPTSRPPPDKHDIQSSDDELESRSITGSLSPTMQFPIFFSEWSPHLRDVNSRNKRERTQE